MTDQFYVILLVVGLLAIFLLLLGVVLEVRYKRSNVSAHARPLDEQPAHQAQSSLPATICMFFLWVALGLALVSMLGFLRNAWVALILPFGIFMAVIHSLFTTSQSAKPWQLIGSLIGLALLAAGILRLAIDIIPINIALPDFLLEQQRKSEEIVFFFILALIVDRRQKPAVVMRTMLVGLVAGFTLNYLLFAPAYAWTLRKYIPVMQPEIGWNLLVNAWLAIGLIGCIGPLTVRWVRPAGRWQRLAVAGAAGAIAGGMVFNFLGSTLVSIIAQSSIIQMVTSLGTYSEARMVYKIAVSAQATYLGTFAMFWLMAGIMGAVSGITGLLTPVKPAETQETVWPLSTMLVAQLPLMALSLMYFTILVTLALQLQTILDTFGLSSGGSTWMLALFGSGQHILALAGLQALTVLWMLRSPGGGRLQRMAGLCAVLAGLTNLAFLLSRTVTILSPILIILSLVLLTAGWRIVRRAQTTEARPDPVHLDWVSSGAGGGLLAALFSHQMLTASWSFVSVGVGQIGNLSERSRASASELKDAVELSFSAASAFLPYEILAGLILGAFIGWVLSRWYRKGWLLALWDSLVASLAKLGGLVPQSSGEWYIVSVFGGIALGVLVVVQAVVPLLWLALISFGLYLFLLKHQPPAHLSKWALIPVFGLAAAGLVLLPLSPGFITFISPMLQRAIFALLFGPVMALAYWAFSASRAEHFRPAWQMAALLSLALAYVLLNFATMLPPEMMGGVMQYTDDEWRPVTVSEFPLGKRLNLTIFPTSQGHLLLADSAGLLLARQSEYWYPYTWSTAANSPSEVQPIRMGARSYLIEDMEGRVWAALGTRLGMFDPSNEAQPFRQPVWDGTGQRLTLPFSGGLPSAITGLACDARGDIWVAVYDQGAIRLEGGRSPEKSMWEWFTPSNSGLISTQIYTLYADRAGNVWFGTQTGLSRFDGAEWQTIETAGWQPGEAIWDILEDSVGAIWIGAAGGGGRWGGNAWAPFSAFPGWEDGKDVHALFEDSQGHIWAGTGSGILRFDGLQWEALLPDSAATVFAESPSGVIWAGGNDGLLRYNTGAGAQETFTARNSGFPTDTVTGIYADPNGDLWVSTYAYATTSMALRVAIGLSLFLFASMLVVAWRKQPDRTIRSQESDPP